MPGLTDADLLMVAEVAGELAKLGDTSFDKAATAFTLTAALIDPAFKTRITEVHRRLEAQRSTKSRGHLASLAPLLRDLEGEAEAVVGGLWEREERVKPCSIRSQGAAALRVAVGEPRARREREQRRKPVRGRSKA
jgi:hypothetical protein